MFLIKKVFRCFGIFSFIISVDGGFSAQSFAYGESVGFDETKFSNGEIARRIGIPSDRRSESIFLRLEMLERNTNTLQTAIDLVRALLGNLPQSSSNPSSSIPSQTLGSSSLEVDRFQGVGEGNILELLQRNEQRTKSFNILKDCFWS